MGQMTNTIFNQIMNGIKELGSSPTIFFGGFGEPLSHPRIVEMVASAKEISPKVELITNGMLLTEEMSLSLHKAGLSYLWVSIDGASPESYRDIRIGAALPEILKNIRKYRFLHLDATGRDPGIGMVFVAMKRNIGDFPELLRMSSTLGISRYLVTNILPYTSEMCEESLYNRTMDALIAEPSPWAPGVDFPPLDADLSTRDSLYQVMNRHHRYFQMDDSSSALHGYCPFVRQGSTAISWDGNVSPCLPLMHQYDSYLKHILRRVKRYVVANVADQNLKGIWESPEYVDFRKRVDEFDFSPCTICASCEMAESNLEDCYGNTYPTCGGCLWAQGFIRCP
jgi:MoaA/NifB/PqqE/SkfB family radical SAM enzyme